MESLALEVAKAARSRKNYGQAKNPDNPIEYLHKFGVGSVFRFMLTHPDMDHMDGIKDFFEAFSPTNYYDTDNNKEMDKDWSGSPYREEDWLLYKRLRDQNPQTNPKRITIYSPDDGIHRTRDWDGFPPGDSFYTLAPTPELVRKANETVGDYHDLSYVVLWNSPAGRVLLSGDSHDETWEYIIDNYEEAVRDVDLFIAPHHGRKSDRNWQFLNVVNPKLTLFGNGESKYLAYDAFRTRNLEFITNNQAGYIVVDCNAAPMTVYVKNDTFANDYTEGTTQYSNVFDGYFLKHITGWKLKEEAEAAYYRY